MEDLANVQQQARSSYLEQLIEVCLLTDEEIVGRWWWDHRRVGTYPIEEVLRVRQNLECRRLELKQQANMVPQMKLF